MGWLRNKEKKKLTKLGILANERAAKLLEELIECCDGKSNPIKFFSANQILNATDSFSESNHISELSRYGFHDAKWYSGKNENHPKILVKKLSRYQDRTFIRDVAVSSIVSGHKNFMKLVGCCFESIDPVMVYDGVKKHYKLDLSKETWKRRMKIAEDIATALAYLHTAFPRPLVYRIFSPGNILVDEDGAAKLTDFSHCVSIPEGETFVKVDNVAGTFGYMDEKYFRNLVVSEETDIFAIGNLMLRLLTGDVMFLKYSSESFSKRFKFIEERRMDEVTDQELLEKMGEVAEDELSQMKAIKMLLLRCVGRKGEIPTMVEVAKELKKIQRSLNTTVVSRYNDSSSSSGETQLNLAQDMSSTVVLSNQTTNT